MIQAAGTIVDYDAVAVTVRFTFEDDSSPTSGIERVRITTDAGVEVPIPQPSGCPARYSAEAAPVPRTELPLWAEAVDCSGEMTGREENGPFFEEESSSAPEPGVPLPCLPAVMCPPDPGCSDAQGELARLNRDLADHCEACQRLRSQWEWKIQQAAAWALLAAIFAVAIGILTLAVATSGWMALLFLALLAAAVIGFGFATWEAQRASLAAERLREDLEACERNLGHVRGRAQEALQSVESSCCPGCIDVPTTLPC